MCSRRRPAPGRPLLLPSPESASSRGEPSSGQATVGTRIGDGPDQRARQDTRLVGDRIDGAGNFLSRNVDSSEPAGYPRRTGAGPECGQGVVPTSRARKPRENTQKEPVAVSGSGLVISVGGEGGRRRARASFRGPSERGAGSAASPVVAPALSAPVPDRAGFRQLPNPLGAVADSRFRVPTRGAGPVPIGTRTRAARIAPAPLSPFDAEFAWVNREAAAEALLNSTLYNGLRRPERLVLDI